MEYDKVESLRKSVRKYTAEPVSEADIEALIHSAQTASVGKHNDAGYVLSVVTDPEVLRYVIKESEEKIPRPDPIFSAPLVIFICRTKDAFEHLMEFDVGVIAEHIHLKATDLGLGSVVLYGFIGGLRGKSDYVSKLGLPEGAEPLLAVAVGHSPLAEIERKADRNFAVVRV